MQCGMTEQLQNNLSELYREYRTHELGDDGRSRHDSK
jgi:hypothetical protein